MQELILFLCEKLGLDKNRLVLSCQSDKGTETFLLQVNSDQLDRLVGGDAKILRAVQTILSASASARNTKVTLEIQEMA